jgi:hypothetical protein
MIYVLWPQGDAIIAAFEVEHTMAIYSNQAQDARSRPMPNIKIDLFMVAPGPAPGNGRL